MSRQGGARAIEAILKGDNYFECQRFRARIPVSVCIARQIALLRGWKSKGFLFPECATCQQGKIIRKGRPGKMIDEQGGNPGMGERKMERATEEVKGGAVDQGGKARVCRECKERPPISDKVDLCARCMQARAMAARVKKTKGQEPKAGEAHKPSPKKRGRKDLKVRGESQGSPKGKSKRLEIDFEGYPEIWDRIHKLAEEEMRPVGVQVIYFLKVHLKVDKVP
jgi:hypothetical protein